MDEPVGTLRSPPASRRSALGWGLLGGVVAVLVFVLVLLVYAWAMGPRHGGGLGGAFFASWMMFLFLYGLLPVFALGAVAGAVAARNSARATLRASGVLGLSVAFLSVILSPVILSPALVVALAAGTLGLWGLVLGLLKIAMIFSSRKGGSDPTKKFATAWPNG